MRSKTKWKMRLSELPKGKYIAIGERDDGLPIAIAAADNENWRRIYMELIELPSRAITHQQALDCFNKAMEDALPAAWEEYTSSYATHAGMEWGGHWWKVLLDEDCPTSTSESSHQRMRELINKHERYILFTDCLSRSLWLNSAAGWWQSFLDPFTQEVLAHGYQFGAIVRYLGDDGIDVWQEVERAYRAGVELDDLLA